MTASRVRRRRRRPSRRLVAVGAAVLAAVAAATAWASLVSTSSPEPPALVRPNIVVVLTDDQSVESVPRMPHVSARSDWVAFDNAFVNVALCCPSRASVLTGQYSHHTRVERNTDGMRLDDGHTVATWLRDGGYRTALLGKYLNQYPWGRAGYLPPGWDEWHVFEDVGYFDYSLNQNGRTVRRGSSARDYSTDVLARKAVKFISRQQGPFFLVVAPNAPHGPRTAPPRHRGIFADARLERPGSFNEADVSDKPAWVRALPPRDAGPTENLRRKQYRSLLAVDDLVRDVFSALDDRRLLHTTVVMFLSDNGYSFGEHRHVGKICPYEECLRIPLLVRYPGRDGTRISDLVQNVDVAATIAELAGVRPTIAQDGLSLLPLMRGRSPSWRSAVLLRWAGYAGSPPDPDTGPDIPGFWGIRTARYKYIELDTGETELYDLHADPGELANRSPEPSSRRLVADLGRQLASLRQG